MSTPNQINCILRHFLTLNIRLMYGYIYLCNLLSMLYGFASGFSMLTDGNVEMPCHHSLWDSANAGTWQENAKVRGLDSPLRLKDAVSRLLDVTLSHDVPEEYWEWDPYSCCVAVNAVSIYVSHMTQGLYLLVRTRTSEKQTSTRVQISRLRWRPPSVNVCS